MRAKRLGSVLSLLLVVSSILIGGMIQSVNGHIPFEEVVDAIRAKLAHRVQSKAALTPSDTIFDEFDDTRFTSTESDAAAEAETKLIEKRRMSAEAEREALLVALNQQQSGQTNLDPYALYRGFRKLFQKKFKSPKDAEKYLKDKRKQYEWTDGSDKFPAHCRKIPPDEDYSSTEIFGIRNIFEQVSLLGLAPFQHLLAGDSVFQTLDDFPSPGKTVGATLPDTWWKDRFFGQQRFQGAGPVFVKKVKALTDISSKFKGLNDPRLKTALDGAAGTPITLESAIAQGKLYVVDYAPLDFDIADIKAAGVKWDVEVHDKTLPSWLPTPIVLLYNNVVHGTWSKSNLLPIAIQVVQTFDPATEQALFFATKDDSIGASTSKSNWPWRFAKTAVQTADMILQQLWTHLVMAHLGPEAIIVGMKRNLLPNHPVYALLIDHMSRTIALNFQARNILIKFIHAWMGMPEGMTYYAVKQLWDKWYEYPQTFVPAQLKARGFEVADDSSITTEKAIFEIDASIPINYHYARDSIPLWRIFKKFHEGAIANFYATDADVANDAPLQAMCSDITTNAKLRGFPSTIKTRAQLVEMITGFVFVVTGFHATMNNQQFELQGYIPNQPHWMYIGTPKIGDVIDEKYLVERIQHTSWHTSWQTSSARLLAVDTEHPITEFMGKYATDMKGSFGKFEAITKELPKLRSRLAKLGEMVRRRNADCPRCEPFHLRFALLEPSKIPVSVEK